MQQGKKNFAEWYPTIMHQAKLRNFDGYNAKRAARDAIAIQTSNHKLQKHALAEGMDYPDFIKYGLALEAPKNQGCMIKKAGGINRIKSGQRFFKEYAKDNKNNSVKGQSEHQGQTNCVIFVDMSLHERIHKENSQPRERNVTIVKRNIILATPKFFRAEMCNK